MPAERIVNDVRKLGFVVAVLVGLALGAAVPALAETAASDAATACGMLEAEGSLLATTGTLTTLESPAAASIAAEGADPEAVLGNGGRDCGTCAAMTTVASGSASAVAPEDVAPADTSEWAVPPSPGQPGEPY